MRGPQNPTLSLGSLSLQFWCSHPGLLSRSLGHPHPRHRYRMSLSFPGALRLQKPRENLEGPSPKPLGRRAQPLETEGPRRSHGKRSQGNGRSREGRSRRGRRSHRSLGSPANHCQGAGRREKEAIGAGGGTPGTLGSFRPGLPGEDRTVKRGPDRSPVGERGVTDPVLIPGSPLPVAPANKGRAVTATLSAPLCLDPKGRRDGDRAGETVEWVKVLAAQPDLS